MSYKSLTFRQEINLGKGYMFHDHFYSSPTDPVKLGLNVKLFKPLNDIYNINIMRIDIFRKIFDFRILFENQILIFMGFEIMVKLYTYYIK